MNCNILIIGSTGRLGIKLTQYCYLNNINIHGATCYKNIKLLEKISKKNKINHTFTLNNNKSFSNFLNYLTKYKFNIIYFLDYGAISIKILKQILLTQVNCNIAIANKEMIIAGGRLLIREIENSKNIFIPLDSEHFSLLNLKLYNDEVDKIFITASGGPFYFKKKLNLLNVNKKKVLSHPKWDMGFNNLIDSSNFINKLLEIFELSSIFDIDIKKIDFVVSPSAYIHSIVLFKDGHTIYNCFNNDMLIPLLKPLRSFYYLEPFKINLKNIKPKDFYFEKAKDKRFKILNYFKFLKEMPHINQIKFMIINNYAQNLYLNNKFKYSDILPYILNQLNNTNIKKYKLKNFDDIIIYINFLKKIYKFENVIN